MNLYAKYQIDLLEQVADAAADVDRERGSIDRDGDPTGWGELLAGWRCVCGTTFTDQQEGIEQ